MSNAVPEKRAVTVRFAGDSGDGMQVTGDQFSDTAALMGNDIATLPDYPAEIRAPAGSLPGVSSYQIQFSGDIIFTPGDMADVLVAMNPAALKVNLSNLKEGGLIIVNTDAFTAGNLKKAGWDSDPLADRTLAGFAVMKTALVELTVNALKGLDLTRREMERCKNFFALGMTFWLYQRTLEHTEAWIQRKFGQRPQIAAANLQALRAGYNFADISEAMPTRYEIKRAPIAPGSYRKITGNEAIAIGLIAAAKLAGKDLFYGTYPITPATAILHALAKHKNYRVKTFQAEDEIAALGAVLGAAFGGMVAACGTSGPGMCLKAEMLNLAVMVELPLVVVNVQRSGPSTGMPTKIEQADLLQSIFGRSGESPLAVLAVRTPADGFEMTLEAVRIAITYMTPVVLLSDSYLANSAEPWRLPRIEELPVIPVRHPAAGEAPFWPYRRDLTTLARPWALPGTPGLEHRIGGLAKDDLTGNVSYDPENNAAMIKLRAEKIRRIAHDIPDVRVIGPAQGKLLVLSWGSTYGAARQAVAELQTAGKDVAFAHLNYLNPFPQNLGSVLRQYRQILIPELNLGQLLTLIRAQFPEVHATGFGKVQGQPFKVGELVTRVEELS